ncbi:MAG: type IX secretion system membrane protein PorP/SprF [Bacteroidetes bacterium]|nr:type IX secretion system membrane protein PorP/SprF [Bacteroidota bacterium]
MKKLRYIIIIGLTVLFIKTVNAQVAPYYTQYMFNDYLVNPAVAGTHNYFQVRANSRIQWIGMDGPRTMSIAAYGPFKERNMGYGGYVYNDVTGPESWTSLGGTYAYNIAINEAWRISGGLSLGMMQYKLDGQKLQMDEDIYDPVIPQGVESRTIMDATAGVYVWTSYYYVGLSAHQLLGNKYGIETDSIKGISRLTQHVYLSGGANFILNREFFLTPSALIRYSAGLFQAEINAKVIYNRIVWGGLSYRTGDAIAVMAGYNYENKIYIGIAYDLPLSDIRQYTAGTMEVMIGYRFDSIK